MAVIELLYDGDDIIDDVIIADAVFLSQANGVAGTCQFRVKDPDQTRVIAQGKSLELIIDGVPEWTGYVLGTARVYAFAAMDTQTPETVTRLLRVDGADLNRLFVKRIVADYDQPLNVTGPTYADYTRDVDVVHDLVTDFLDLSGDDLDVTSRVQNIGTVNEDEVASPIQPTNNWANTMNSIIVLTGGIYYIDPERRLVLADTEEESAPFFLADLPVTIGGVITWQDQGTVTAGWQAATLYGVAEFIIENGVLWWTVQDDPATSGGVMPDFDPDVGFYEGDGGVTWSAFTSEWQPETDYFIGDFVQPTPFDARLELALSSGRSGLIQPIWASGGGTVDDGADPAPDPDACGYREAFWTIDGTKMVNDVIIWGAGRGSSQMAVYRHQATSSIDEFGRWQVGEFHTDMYKQTTVQRRAESIVEGSEQSHRGGRRPYDEVNCVIFRQGLQVGMVVQVYMDTFGLAKELPVRRMEITFPTPTDVRYKLQLAEIPDPPWGFMDIVPFGGFPGPRVDPPQIDVDGIPELGFEGWIPIDTYAVRGLCNEFTFGRADSDRPENRMWWDTAGDGA